MIKKFLKQRFRKRKVNLALKQKVKEEREKRISSELKYIVRKYFHFNEIGLPYLSVNIFNYDKLADDNRIFLLVKKDLEFNKEPITLQNVRNSLKRLFDRVIEENKVEGIMFGDKVVSIEEFVDFEFRNVVNCN